MISPFPFRSLYYQLKQCTIKAHPSQFTVDLRQVWTPTNWVPFNDPFGWLFGHFFAYNFPTSKTSAWFHWAAKCKAVRFLP